MTSQRAIDRMTTLLGGHADVRRVLASYPRLAGPQGLSNHGAKFCKVYAEAIKAGRTGREAEILARRSVLM